MRREQNHSRRITRAGEDAAASSARAARSIVSSTATPLVALHRGEHGEVNHAELALGAGIVMLGQARPAGWLGGRASDARASTASIYVVVADPDAHYERARAAGAEIVRELTNEDYGSREYSARDLEGNLWSFGTYDPYDEGRAA